MGQLFGSKPKAPKPVPMVDTSSPVVKAANDRMRRDAIARGGRASTVLSPNTTGSTAYGSTLLGQ